MRDRLSVSRCCCFSCDMWSDYFDTDTIADYTIASGSWSISGGAISTAGTGEIFRTAAAGENSYILGAEIESPGSGQKAGLYIGRHPNPLVSEYLLLEITWGTPITYEVIQKRLVDSYTFPVANGTIYGSTGSDAVTIQCFPGVVELSVDSSYVSIADHTGYGASATSKIGLKSYSSLTANYLTLEKGYESGEAASCPVSPVCSFGSISDDFSATRNWWKGGIGTDIVSVDVGPVAYELDSGSYLARRHDGTYGYATTISMCVGMPAVGTHCDMSVDVSWKSGTYPIMALTVTSETGIRSVAVRANVYEHVVIGAGAGVDADGTSYEKSYSGTSATLRIEWDVGAGNILTNVKFYVDGTLYHTTASTLSFEDAVYLSIGSSAGEPGLNSTVKDVRFDNFSYVES